MSDALEIYKRELLRWNEKVNLIGPEARANLEEHVSEALSVAEILKPEREVLDFGTGGGLPAIPMARTPSVRIFFPRKAGQGRSRLTQRILISTTALRAESAGSRRFGSRI